MQFQYSQRIKMVLFSFFFKSSIFTFVGNVRDKKTKQNKNKRAEGLYLKTQKLLLRNHII